LHSATKLSKWYLVALVCRDAIFRKSASFIWHVAPAGYWKALALLDDISGVERLALAKDKTSKSYDTILKGSKLPALKDDPDQLHDDVEPNDDSDDDGNGGDGNVASADPLPIAHAAFVAEQERVAPVMLAPRADGTRPIVHFDGCSHKSGILRGYIRCCHGHPRCFKYQQLNVAGTRKRLVAFLSAWLDKGAHLTHAEHIGPAGVPDEDQVQQHLARVVGG
jgi:hypothetical protein